MLDLCELRANKCEKRDRERERKGERERERQGDREGCVGRAKEGQRGSTKVLRLMRY